jgi:hypothetical protein
MSNWKMMIRWRFILPIAGLILFALVSWQAFSRQREIAHRGKYFWWSSIMLDTDPAGKTFKPLPPSKEGIESSCWDPIYLWRRSDWLAGLFILSGFPAFMTGVYLARLLGKLAVSEVTTFMFAMPLLLLTWYYLLGWWIDRRRAKRHRSSAT